VVQVAVELALNTIIQQMPLQVQLILVAVVVVVYLLLKAMLLLVAQV